MGYGEYFTSDEDNAVYACLFTGYHGRLFFYIVPSSVFVFISAVLVIYTLFKVVQDNSRNQRSLRKSVSGPRVRVYQIASKLLLAYGMGEIFSFVQVPPKNETAEVINASFTSIYSIVRSMRGVVILLVYICKRNVYRLYKEYLEVTAARLQEWKRATDDVQVTPPTEMVIIPSTPNATLTNTKAKVGKNEKVAIPETDPEIERNYCVDTVDRQYSSNTGTSTIIDDSDKSNVSSNSSVSYTHLTLPTKA